MLRSLPIVLLLLVLAVPATFAQDTGVGIRLVEVNQDQVDDPRARLYIVDAVNPGATIERDLEVLNRGSSRATFELVGASASVEDGWSLEPSGEVARWIEVEPSTITLDAGEVGRVTARIVVPGDAAAGEHYGAVVARLPQAEQAAVDVVSGVGIRAYLFILGDNTSPVSDFEITALTAFRTDGGTPAVNVEVVNTGTRALDIGGELSLTEGPGGSMVGPFDVAIPTTVGPGARSSVPVMLDPELPAGPWLARADLASGDLERSAEARITFPAGAGETAAPSEATPIYRDRGVLLPLAMVLLLIAFLLVLLAWWLAKRRRRDEEAAEEPAPAPSETSVGT